MEASSSAALRVGISDAATTAVNIIGIRENEPVSRCLSPHWKHLAPACELVKASVTDETSLPYHFAQVNAKISELKQKMAAGDLNIVAALNIIQMVSDQVQYTQRMSRTDQSTQSELATENERLKIEVLHLKTTIEELILKQDRNLELRDKMQEVLSEFEGGLALDLFKTPSIQKNETKQKTLIPSKKSNRVAQRVDVQVDISSHQSVPPSPHPLASSMPSSPHPFASSMPPSPHPLAIPSEPSVPPSPRPLADYPLNLQYILNTASGNNNIVESTNEKETKKERRESKRRRKEETPVEEEMGEDEPVEPPKRTRGEGRTVPPVNAEEGTYKCPFEGCDRAFNKISTISEHALSEHYWQGALQLVCSECHANFDNERSFESHALNCPSGEASVAAKKWEHEETKQEREERVELEKRLVTCPYDECDFSSKSKTRGIFKHIGRSHADKGKAVYKCDYCGKTWKTLYTILFHHYSECRQGKIDWCIDAPRALKKADNQAELSWLDE